PVEFPNVEAYFQHCKRALYAESIEDPYLQAEVCEKFRQEIADPKYKNTSNAYHLGRSFETAGIGKFDVNKWNQKKTEVMRRALRAKFEQNPLLKAMLLETLSDPRPLVQLKVDNIWGPGKDGKGRNLLGVLLHIIRQ